MWRTKYNWYDIFHAYTLWGLVSLVALMSEDLKIAGIAGFITIAFLLYRKMLKAKDIHDITEQYVKHIAYDKVVKVDLRRIKQEQMIEDEHGL